MLHIAIYSHLYTLQGNVCKIFSGMLKLQRCLSS